MARLRSRYLLTLIVVLAIDKSFCTPYTDKKLSRLNRCGGKTSSALSNQTVKVRSKVHCASHCLRNGDQCMSVIYDDNSKLCHINSDKNASLYCSNSEETSGVLLEKQSDCQHMGYTDANGNCICVNGYVGAYCERLMTDCTDGYNSGFYTDPNEIIFDIQPISAPAPFKVLCSFQTLRVRTYVLNRKFDPTFNFNRTWAEYRDGFGSLDRDHWLGLEKLHHLTAGNRNFELRLQVRPKQTSHGSYYTNFVLANESNSYTFSFTRLRSTSILDDCLTDLQGAKFSTYDADNDDNPSINCARKHGGGWWFKGPNCSVCNPMGPLLPPFNTSTEYRIGFRKFVPGEAFWGGLGELYPYHVIAYLIEM